MKPNDIGVKVICAIALIIVLIILIVNTINPIKVMAQSKADSLSIISVTCFRHLLENDDLLVLIHYDIEYSVLPDENADDLYMMRMFVSGSPVAIDLPYVFGDQRGYNEGVGGFYWAASGSQPAWGGYYEIVLQGNPTVWGDVEDWKYTETLGDTDWSNFDTATENQTFLGLTVLDIADSIETDWGTTLVATGSIGDQLNDTGSSYFNGAVPALSLMEPAIFSVVETWPDWSDREWTRDYSDGLEDTLDGTPLGNLVAMIERNMSISFIAAGSVIVFALFIMVVIMTITKCKGQGDDGILVAMPVLLMGVRLGLLSMSIIAIYALCSIMLVGYILFFRHG